jgi:uncharacterized protein YgiM (DUF1202 family)
MTASAQEHSFPYLGQVIGDQINVRAGQSSNFERLLRLDKGDSVVVLGSEFSWLKIRLPHTVDVYVSSKYMQMVDASHAQVIGDRLNVRAKPDTNSAILGQLEKSDIVNVRESTGEWLRIEPTSKTFGWIAGEFVKFTSRDISQVEMNVGTSPKEAPLPVAEVIATVPPPQTSSGPLSITGVVVPVNEGDKTSYKITDDQDKEYRLQMIDQDLMKRFLHYKVSIEGNLQPDVNGPALIISNIQLVL